MTAALLGFIGGIAAVGVKGWVDYFLEQRRHARETVAALRLVCDEAGDGRAWARTMLDVGKWLPQEDDPTAFWNEVRPVLAASLDELHWQTAVNVRLHLDRLQRRALAGGDMSNLTDDDRAIVSDAEATLGEREEIFMKLTQQLLAPPLSLPRLAGPRRVRLPRLRR